VIKKELKRAEHFKIVLNRDKVTGNDIERNEKVCYTLVLKEDIF